MIVLILIAAVVAAVVVFVNTLSTDAREADSTPTLGTAKAATTGSADPAQEAEQHILSQKITSQTIDYGTTGVFDACAVLPLSVLEANGIKPYPHGLLNHQYIEKSVSGDRATVRDSAHDITTCSYLVPGSGTSADGTDAGRTGLFSLDIKQTPFNRVFTFDLASRDGDTTRSAAGLTVYLRGDGNRLEARTGNENVFVRLAAHDVNTEYGGVDIKTVFNKIVDEVAANLAKGPTQQARFTNGGSYSGVPSACEWFTADVFTQATGAPDSGWVRETSSHDETWVAEFDGTNSFQISQECSRSAPDVVNNRDSDSYLKVRFEVYRDETAATHADYNYCDPSSPTIALTGKPVPASEKVGDGAACVSVIGSPEYHFRVGRVAVSMGPAKWVGDDLTKIATALTPAAKKLATTLPN
ncbi:hypothetical protein [Goodfellowiella coeruleoviolacea]|uniref:Uncharacterized protein n=1 Tax=Goodfellowiella coeruleoviolacea TaxID=334858 RepID=A0AAE3GB14_9PSEU|nr:hypothetical protein [Goodfellowiella coeruleoviolacea]MCP2164987.1 hypothetical protein [Goodfellowiella coeruleoviolacea]